MDIDLETISKAFEELSAQGPAPLRFQILCPACVRPVWANQDIIGNQLTCGECDAVITVQPPENLKPPGTNLTLFVAGSPRHRNVYAIVEPLNLDPASSAEDLLLAYHDGDDEAEALRQLRNLSSRLATDLLCYPHWNQGKT